jgi:hypothetical protein
VGVRGKKPPISDTGSSLMRGPEATGGVEGAESCEERKEFELED